MLKVINKVGKSGKKWEKFYIFDSYLRIIVISLIGTYECKADAKGRVMLAAPLKKQLLPALSDGFVLKRAVFQKCLELYPMQEWNAMMEKINKLNRFRKKNNDFIRLFTAGVKVVDVDASGRILIPRDLINFAGIGKDLVLSSAVNIIEIWDKDTYEKAVNDAMDGFADLAEEVMGNENESTDELS